MVPTHKSVVFGLSSSLPLLVGGGGGGVLVSESVGMADLLSDHFDDKQPRESVDRLGPLSGHRPICMFPLFLMRTADVVGSSRTIYGTQWCASNHIVCFSERSWYL